MRVRNLMRVFANLRESDRAWLLHAWSSSSSRWLLWREAVGISVSSAGFKTLPGWHEISSRLTVGSCC